MFKAYSAKSKAKRALLAKIADANPDLYLFLGANGDEMQWGFDTDEQGNPVLASAGEASPTLEQPTAHPACSGGALVTTAEPSEPASEDEPAWEGLDEPKAAPNPWAQLTGSHTVPESARNVQKGPRVAQESKIEKNRPEQNGVKRPSEGTICRHIWDTMQVRLDGGDMPTLPQAREQLRDREGLDNTTVTVQYYRWRKYNGIKGRTPKA